MSQGDVRVFLLPWPPAALSSNARLHWRKLAAAKKSYRIECWGAALEVDTKGRQRLRPLPDGELRVALEFRPPDRREYDKDNLLSRMKAGLDGLADALQVNDRRFSFPVGSMGRVVKGGAVVVEIGRPREEHASTTTG